MKTFLFLLIFKEDGAIIRIMCVAGMRNCHSVVKSTDSGARLPGFKSWVLQFVPILPPFPHFKIGINNHICFIGLLLFNELMYIKS